VQPSLHNNVDRRAHLVKSAKHATFLCLNKDALSLATSTAAAAAATAARATASATR